MEFDKNFVETLVNKLESQDCIKLYNYLNSEDSDFFECPGSTRFHHSYKGGLLVHCCQIFEYLLRYKVSQMFRLDKIEFDKVDAFLLAFGHDLSKIKKYKEELGWTKVNGKWESILKFGYNDENIMPHELGSVYLITKLLPNLDFKIAQAIAYHHGGFGVDSNNFITACEQNPMVLALHTADMESSIKDNLERNK